ncbi:MAG: glycosyltransferase family 4 protein [Streptomycetales bacterium]
MISQWYEPEVQSATVPSAISRSLTALGHDVSVLTGFPNYPSGRIYPGYQLRPYQFESRSGVGVHRVPLWPSHDRSAVKRAANYLSFASSAATRLRILRSVDAWLVYSTPATVAIPALVAKAVFRRPFVLLIQDLWPDTVVESGFVGGGKGLELMVRSLHKFCDATYRNASAVAVTAPGMAELLRRRGVGADKLDVVPNWVDEEAFRPVPRDREIAREFDLSGFVVMYAGNLGDFQGLDTIIEASDLLGDIPELKVVFVGAGVAEGRLRAAAERAGRRNILFLGQQPLDRMAALMALSDVQLVTLQDLPLFHATLPSKVQTALASGRPIVAAVPGDASRIIGESGAGLAVRPGDAGALADALRRMYRVGEEGRESMGRRGRAFYLEQLSARVGSVKLARLLESAAARGAGRPR